MKGDVKVSTTEIVLLKVFTVRISPVSKLYASDVGFTPTWVDDVEAESGLKATIEFPPLEVM